MISAIDSLNNLTTEDDELVKKQIREYFEEMELPEEEIEKRIGFATDIEKVFRNLFLLMLGADILGNDLQSNASSYADYAYNRVHDSMVEYGYSREQGYEPYGYIEQYTKQRCKEIVDTTILHRADSFYLSADHSIAIAEDETNAIANYDMEQMAIAQGFTMKTWVTMHDRKVRHTHELCDGKTINIFKAFDVGNYQMMFPCDHSLGASMKEIANCRCVVEYSGKDKNSENGFKEFEKDTVINTNELVVNFKALNTYDYRKRFDGITESENGDTKVCNEAKEVLKHRSGTTNEDLVYFDAKNGNVLQSIKNSTKSFGVEHTPEVDEFLKSSKSNIIALHNHPSSSRPSVDDMLTSIGYNRVTKTLDYTCIEKSVVVCHNSDVYVLENIKHNLDIAKQIEEVYDSTYNYYIQLYDVNLATTKATDIVYEFAKDKHAFDLRKLINEKR